MKKVLFFYFIALVCISAHAQTPTSKRIPKTIVQQRSIYLNGGARSYFGGKSRIDIPIQLPPNTKTWYYSFSTSPGESGTQNLNLAIQLSSLLVDPTGIGKNVLENVSVPQGSNSIDVYLLDRQNVDPFINKEDFQYSRLGSTENTKQAVVDITNTPSGVYYLGLKNPSELDGVNITIEVVAVVEEKTEEENQAMTYGNLGWKAFERGDYDRCMELSKKAIAFDSTLAFIHFNLGLTYFIKGKNTEAIDAYTKAIFIAKKSENPKHWFEGAIQDLNKYMDSFISKADAKDILDLLQTQSEGY